MFSFLGLSLLNLSIVSLRLIVNLGKLCLLVSSLVKSFLSFLRYCAFNLGSLILLISSRNNSSCSSYLVRTFTDLVKTFTVLQQLLLQPKFISGEYEVDEESYSLGDISFSLSVFLNSKILYKSSLSFTLICNWLIFCFTLQLFTKWPYFWHLKHFIFFYQLYSYC